MRSQLRYHDPPACYEAESANSDSRPAENRLNQVCDRVLRIIPSARRHPAHPIMPVLIVHRREVPAAVLPQNYDTGMLRCYTARRIDYATA